MTQTAKLLTPPHNFAVVQLPDREYPGVVIQGDSLSILVSELRGMAELLEAGDLPELRAQITEVHERLSGVLDHYRSVVGDRLPF